MWPLHGLLCTAFLPGMLDVTILQPEDMGFELPTAHIHFASQKPKHMDSFFLYIPSLLLNDILSFVSRIIIEMAISFQRAL